MSFRKDPYKIEQKQAMFGKNVIITPKLSDFFIQQESV
jgi:hypothetical protein